MSTAPQELRADDGRPMVVVGAGMAGLLAARTLAEAGHAVVVLDKGRGVGGRLATRRLAAGVHGTGVADHGAQFFTARSPEVRALVEGWLAAGVVEPWFSTRLERDGSHVDDGDVRYRVAGGMTALAKHLADGLDVRTGVVVSAVTPTGSGPGAGAGWRVVFDGAAGGPTGALEAAAVVLTAPVPQARALLDAGGVTLAADDAEALAAIAYDPCLAVLAVLDGPAGLPAPGAIRPGGEVVEWVADNQAKGISPCPVVTVHGSAAWSVALWDEPDGEVARLLLAAAGLTDRVLCAPDPHGVPAAQADCCPGGVCIDGPVVKRWRYSKPSVVHPEPALRLAGLPPLVVAGDAFGGPRVEGAARSGLAAAADLLGGGPTTERDR